MDQFSYYVIRIRQLPGEEQTSASLAGVVERLGAGEKRSFAGGDELLRMLSQWAGGPTNMGMRQEADKS